MDLQTVETWKEFIGTDNVSFGSDSSKVYFEGNDFDKFDEKLKKCEVEYVHPVKEHSWGQRVVRIYDPDKHIIDRAARGMLLERKFKKMDLATT